ncbi:DUF2333 family protein [Pseudoalteromonas sp. OFAV1]|jgi:hypothetical protein|uniref:DUF2333 family protein n=1 Tax=Pseudoalteromonas sp. OFAV1 TaxID=2908892 RepID=UPI001F213552|nr:DUF2333 family protein [Pseudoalteromonas sp. OFAV1]MCF2902988.1 DUF2333 family protein [Pseudoalteromonas sp. OFAV1]
MKSKLIASITVALVLLYSAWGVYISLMPKQIDPMQATQEHVSNDITRKNLPPSGAVFTSTLVELIDNLLEKNGGYVSNDLAVKAKLYDNMPNMELGMIYMIRDAVDLLRSDFSRSQSQSKEDDNLKKAQPAMNIDNKSWIFPASESSYREASEHILLYLKDMVDPTKPDVQFYTRADNLVKYFDKVNQRLGAMSHALIENVGQERINTNLAGDSAARETTYTRRTETVQHSWMEIDNAFYEARGSVYALIPLLKAIRIDFYEVLEKKNAIASLDQIILEMEETQKTVWSPAIMNGSGFGLFANHSLSMASYIGRANAAIIDLKNLLEKG